MFPAPSPFATISTDIHAYIEFRFRNKPEDRWQSYHQGGELYIGNQYDLFNALANARRWEGDDYEEDYPSALFPPRGYPDDGAQASFLKLHYPIYEDGSPPAHCENLQPSRQHPHVLRSEVRPGHMVVRRDGLEYVREDAEIHHHTSYLTHAEILLCIGHFGPWLEGVCPFFEAAIAAMGILEKHYDTRLVFWFDS